MPAANVDILTARTLDRGYAEQRPGGLTGGYGQASYVVSTTAETGAGSLKAGLASGNKYITFSISNATITWTSELITGPFDNVTIDAVGRNVTLAGHRLRFESCDNIIIAGLKFQDAGTNRDNLTITNNSDVKNIYFGVYGCTFANESIPSPGIDSCIDVIYKRSDSVYVTVADCIFRYSARFMLIHSGEDFSPFREGVYPNAGGSYYVTVTHNWIHHVFERLPFGRDMHTHMFNNAVERYGAASSGSAGAYMGDAQNPPVGFQNWMLIENNVAMPYATGETDLYGVAVTDAQINWSRPSNTHNGTPVMKHVGTYLKQNGTNTPTQTSLNSNLAGTPPYEYQLAAANDALQTFLSTHMGHGAALATPLTAPGQALNPAANHMFVGENQLITVRAEDDIETVTSVVLKSNGVTVATMTEVSPNVWEGYLSGMDPVGTITDLYAEATTTGVTVSSPVYPVLVTEALPEPPPPSPGTGSTILVDPYLTIDEIFRTSDVNLSRAMIILNSGEIYDDTFYGGSLVKMIADGSSVEYDRMRETRATARCRFIAANKEVRDALHPINKVFVQLFSGTVYRGETLWAPLGTFLLDGMESQELTDAWILDVTMMDKSEVIRENPWKQPFQSGGGTFRAAIEEILTDRGNPAEHTLWKYEHTANDAPDLYYTENDDPWAAIYNLGVSAESEIYFSKNDWLVIEKVAEPGTAEAPYLLGGTQFQTEDGSRSYRTSRREIYNGVICRGEAPWLLFPISGEYWDDDPSSPTYRGANGENERPKVIGSPIATTNAHCAEIAEAEYRKVAGVSEEVVFKMMKDPYLNVGRIIEIVGSRSFYSLDRLLYPLGSGSMQGTVRRKHFA